ncbi:MAG: hypothetical protein ACRDFW_08960 [bacterium]
MDTHLAQIAAEARLEKASRSLGKWAPIAESGCYVRFNGFLNITGDALAGGPLDENLVFAWAPETLRKKFLLTFGADPLDARWNPLHGATRHTHDLVCHPVRFLLELVAWLIYCQLRLNQAGSQQPLNGLIALSWLRCVS